MSQEPMSKEQFFEAIAKCVQGVREKGFNADLLQDEETGSFNIVLGKEGEEPYVISVTMAPIAAEGYECEFDREVLLDNNG